MPAAPSPQSTAATPITSATEARFKAIADKRPLMTDAEIQQSLAATPAISKDVYNSWLTKYIGDRTQALLKAPPMSATAAGELLKTTKYDDPASLLTLTSTIVRTPGMARLPLGYYVGEDQKKQFCFLQPGSAFLPNDLVEDPTRGDPLVTQARPNTNVAGFPSFYLEIGQLCVATDATAIASAPLTNFVVVVAPDRKVYTLFNPLGHDPAMPTNAESEAQIQKRPKAGKVPALSAPFSCTLLAAKVDDLVGTDVINKVLALSTKNNVTVGDTNTMKFGGIDSTAWKTLDGVSPAFARVYKRPTK